MSIIINFGPNVAYFPNLKKNDHLLYIDEIYFLDEFSDSEAVLGTSC